jgi:hypothetical protein
MKAIAIIVLLPLVSVVVVSLYAMGGAPRWAGVGLLLVSVIAVAAFAVNAKRQPNKN